jgi:NADPH:quinone reductase-like Zn-dependent oxidoreductase
MGRTATKRSGMKAVVCDGYGAPGDVLRLADVDDPEVGDDAVLLRVHASSVNPADWHVIRGDPFVARLLFGLRRPNVRVPGCDVAGRVEAVGRNVTAFRPGDDVFGARSRSRACATTAGSRRGSGC